MGSRPLTAGWTASAPLQVHEFPDLVSALAGVGLTTPARRNRRIA
jgi:hypothetical protein